jgi:hypothetical protein
MYLGVVPDVLPLAPRPVEGELRSSWLLRVAAANALTLGELMDAAAGRHPLAGVDRAFLDDGLSPPVVAALAQFARLHETAVRGLDLAWHLPGLPDGWVLRGSSLYVGSRDRVSDRRAHYAFCPRCLVSASPTSTPPYIPAEWACAIVTHCPTHHTRLLDRCPACFALDPFVIGVGEPPGLAECWQCDAILGLPDWPPDALAAIEPALHLQATLIRALRDQTSSHWAIGPATARMFVRLVAELLDLLVDVDDGEPVFARVAAIHWPDELRVVGRPTPESRFAYLPVRWRFLAMASAAAVLGDPSADGDHVLDGPRQTLAASLGEHEWQRWEEHMGRWPPPIRQRLAAARHEHSPN